MIILSLQITPTTSLSTKPNGDKPIYPNLPPYFYAGPFFIPYRFSEQLSQNPT